MSHVFEIPPPAPSPGAGRRPGTPHSGLADSPERLAEPAARESIAAACFGPKPATTFREPLEDWRLLASRWSLRL